MLYTSMAFKQGLAVESLQKKTESSTCEIVYQI